MLAPVLTVFAEKAVFAGVAVFGGCFCVGRCTHKAVHVVVVPAMLALFFPKAQVLVRSFD